MLTNRLIKMFGLMYKNIRIEDQQLDLGIDKIHKLHYTQNKLYELKLGG